MRLWILNHYATDMYFDEGGRHHAFAKYLIRMGHDVKIFCANTVHNSDAVVNLQGNQYIEKTGADHVPYIFVKARPYQGNGKKRILNMVDYFRNIKYVLNDYKKEEGMPDIILASSVHPLTLVAGIKWAHKNNIKCICEVRDLWPETFVELNLISSRNLLTRILYLCEKKIYTKADSLIFTMPGGKKYITDKKWQNDVKLDKIYHINNGVDLEKFKADEKEYIIKDDDLEDDKYKIIYAGSIRKANKIEELVCIAKILSQKKIKNVKILIYGDGDQKEPLCKLVEKLDLDNIVFKGHIEKNYVPYILSKGNLNIAIDEANNLGRYGISWNKIFEYMASGIPAIVNYDMGEFNIVEEHGFGRSKEYKNIDEFCNDIIDMTNITSDDVKRYSQNASDAVRLYDYKNLTNCLYDVIYKTMVNEG